PFEELRDLLVVVVVAGQADAGATVGSDLLSGFGNRARQGSGRHAAASEVHRCAGPAELEGDALAYATAGPGDDGNLAVQASAHGTALAARQSPPAGLRTGGKSIFGLGNSLMPLAGRSSA